MKKAFLAICTVVPGGFVLLVMMALFTGCARLQFQDPAGNAKISGFTVMPEAAMMASAETEMLRAQAYATRQCSDDSKHCGAVWGPWGGEGGLYTPYGYTMAGINAVAQEPSAQAPQDVKKELVGIKESQRATNSALRALNQKVNERNK